MRLGQALVEARERLLELRLRRRVALLEQELHAVVVRDDRPLARRRPSAPAAGRSRRPALPDIASASAAATRAAAPAPCAAASPTSPSDRFACAISGRAAVRRGGQLDHARRVEGRLLGVARPLRRLHRAGGARVAVGLLGEHRLVFAQRVRRLSRASASGRRASRARAGSARASRRASRWRPRDRRRRARSRRLRPACPRRRWPARAPPRPGCRSARPSSRSSARSRRRGAACRRCDLDPRRGRIVGVMAAPIPRAKALIASACGYFFHG